LGGLEGFRPKRQRERGSGANVTSHTVDGDGNALSEDIAIGAHKGRNFVKRVGLGELRGRVLWVGVNLLEVEVVGLRNGADGRGAGVALTKTSVSNWVSINLSAFQRTD
jgi:hypothetical protein